MVLILLFGVFIARSLSHTITSLDLPRWADPGRPAELRCHYIRQHEDPVLHSVKWYRDHHEVFRYTPLEFETRLFNNTGIEVTNSSCNSRTCVILIRPDRGTSKFTCEVSSEGPRFAVDRQSANLTLAVLPEYDPLITGLPTMIYPGDEAQVNCTSDYSLPAATLEWFIDDELQEDPKISSGTHISGADSEGLRASWRTLHVAADAFDASRGYLSLRCRATVATRPPRERSMAVRLYVARRPHLSKFTANYGTSGCSLHRIQSTVFVWTFLIIAKSAFNIVSVSSK